MMRGGIVLEGSSGFLIEQSLIFIFKASKNQAEYEALIAGLQLAQDMGACRLLCRTDSNLMVGQMNKNFQVKDEHVLRYFHKAITIAKKFEQFTLQHIPREENTRAE